MQGQINHFLRYNLSDQPETYALNRYANETRRLYRTLNKHLSDAKSDFLVGNKATIADFAITAWVNIAGKLHQSYLGGVPEIDAIRSKETKTGQDSPVSE
jgi:glutathione S-transferase